VFASADKLVHLAMYGVLGALLARAAAAPPNRAWPATRLLAIALAFGAADELHQQFVPGRSAELLDWGADATGAALGIFLTTLALRRRELET